MAKPCPTCNAIITKRQTRCNNCTKRQRQTSRQRNPRTDAHYATTTWRRTRRAFLNANPNCWRCGNTATDVDHAPPRRILLAAGYTNPDKPTLLAALCHRCHSHITRTIDKPLLAQLDAGKDPEPLAVLALQARTELRHTSPTR